MTGNTTQSTHTNSPADLLQALRRLQEETDNDLLDLDKVQSLTAELLKHFRASTDAAQFDYPLKGPGMLAEFAVVNFNTTLATLSSRELEQTLFEVIPANMPTSSNDAKSIVETLRAFFGWLKREHALQRADDFIDLLQDDATRELQQVQAGSAFADVSHHGDDQPGGYEHNATRSETPAQRRASQKRRKKNRKASRKARKKNR